jgi:hypothetical protein
MTPKDREIQRKLKILKHAEETAHVGRTCRHFGIGRASFYRWKPPLEKHGDPEAYLRSILASIVSAVYTP